MGKGKNHRRAGGTEPNTTGTQSTARARTPDVAPLGGVRLYGLHAVAAAIANPRRTLHRLLLTGNAEDTLRQTGLTIPDLRERATPRDLDALLGPDAVHQGVVLEVAPLPDLDVDDVAAITDADRPARVIVLDQVTDPHNVGAILRSAAAFGAAALITQDRHSPRETGSLAKSASGGLEAVPWVRVTNLSRALDQLAELGFWRVGLDGEADDDLAELDPGRRVALVLGSEGRGMRPNTRAHCDMLARLPITDKVESLNVSNAAAVALYELAKKRIQTT